jgi:hypothetical protein
MQVLQMDYLFNHDLKRQCRVWHLWRLGAPHPLFSAGSATEQFTAAVWSPTREAVLFLGLADGSVQCWDLLDRSHEPALQVCAVAGACLVWFQLVCKAQHAGLCTNASKP